MNVRFLGTGAAIDTQFFHACVVLDPPGDAPILIDASPECSVLLRRHGYAPHDLQAVLLTHLHGDHMLGLPLLLAEFLISSNPRPLVIAGPSGTEDVIRSLLRLSWPGEDPAMFLEKANVVFAGAPLALSPFRVDRVPAKHGGVEAYGYRIETDALTIFHSGDTALSDDVRAAVSQSDFSILDVTTIDTTLPTHMNFADAVRLMAQTREGQYAFAIHRTFAEPDEHPERLLFPADGSAYRLERGRAPVMLV